MELILIIFTLGYVSQLIGNYILIRKIRKTKNTQGLSFDTQILNLIGAAARVIWVFDTRLKKHVFVWIELILSLAASLYIVYLFRKYKDNKFERVENPIKFYYILIFAAIFSIFFHPGSKTGFKKVCQILVSLTMFLEALGLLPQIYILRKLKEIEVAIGNYLVLMALSRILRLVFWIFMWMYGDSFIFLMVADFLYTCLLGDFVYYYIKSRTSGQYILIK